MQIERKFDKKAKANAKVGIAHVKHDEANDKQVEANDNHYKAFVNR